MRGQIIKRRPKYLLAVIFVVVCAAFILVSGKANADDGKMTVEVSGIYGQTEARTMLDRINKFRTGEYVDGGRTEVWALDKNGNDDFSSYKDLGELQYDYELEKVAMQRAIEIALRFDHVRPDDSSCYAQFPEGYTAKGENIATGYGSSPATALQAFEQWAEVDRPYEGQGHRRNMLGRGFNRIGIAFVKIHWEGLLNEGVRPYDYSTDIYYWVQEFGYRADNFGLSPTIANNSETVKEIELKKSNIEKADISANSSTVSMEYTEEKVLNNITSAIRFKDTWPKIFELTWSDGAVTKGTYKLPVVGGFVLESSNLNIVDVDGNKIIAKGIGKTTIIARSANDDSKYVEIEVTVTPKSIADALVDVETSYMYNRFGVKPEPTVVLDGKTLKKDIDYELNYLNNDNVGEAKVVVSGKGSYKDSVERTFTITPKTLEGESITVDSIENCVYNGSGQEPKPVVKDGETTLVEGTDYDLSYSNNKNVGTAKVTITGKGNYQDSIEKTFTINKKALTPDMVELSASEMGYTGALQKPEVTVSDGDALKDNDYTITNEGGKERGDYNVVVTATANGNYTGTITKEFSITPKALSADMIDIGSDTFTYNGKNQKPNSVTVKNGDLTLKEGTDYTLTNEGGTNAGTYKVTVAAKGGGNYSGSAEKEYTIGKKELSADMVTLDKTEFEYNGDVQRPEVTVSDKADDEEIIKASDYKITNNGGTKAGTYKVTVAAEENGNYKDPQQQIEQSYTIKAKSMTSEDIKVSDIDDVAYSGSEQEPKPVVKDGETTLVEGTDYDLSYLNNKNVGAVKVTITGKGNYTGTRTKEFSIIPKALSADMIDIGSGTFTYNGKNQKPNSVTVKNGVLTLEEGKDYTLTNEGGTNAGTYNVTVTAEEGGNYSGSAEKEYTIGKKELSADMVTLDKTEFVYNGDVQKPKVTVSDKVDGAEIIETRDYEITNDGGTNVGTYKVTVTAKGDGNYSGSAEKEYTIKKDNPTDNPIDNPKDNPTDNPTGGKPNEKPEQPGQTPGTTPTPGSGNEQQPTDQKGADGTALGQGASAQAAEAAIMGMKNDNDPAGSAFGKLQMRSTKQTKNSIKLAWKKVSGAVKYIVYGNQCGIKNKMKKITEVSSASFNVKKIEGKGLKKGTSYKFILVAIDGNSKVVSSSKVIHVFTAGGKNGNHKKVIVKAKVGKKVKAVKKVTIKVRKKVKLKAQLVSAKKKLKVKKHAAVRFESDKPKIAVVSKTGVIKGLKKGKCTIFAYAQNGAFAKINVTVK